jgi:hypothetical protein
MKFLPHPSLFFGAVVTTLLVGNRVAQSQDIAQASEVIQAQAEISAHQLASQLGLSLLMLLLCVFVHIVLTWMVFASLRDQRLLNWISRFAYRRILLVVGVVVASSAAMLVEILIWSVLYVHLGVFTSFETSLYFSSVTFSSLGYGDITLEEQFRLLGAMQSLVGVLMVGWSTSLFVGVTQKMITMRDAIS